MRIASDLGAAPFEVIAGTPRSYYGARVTFLTALDPQQFLAAFGLDKHPWGVPQWVGLRLSNQAGVVAKAYHSGAMENSALPFDLNFIARLDPIMSSLHDGSVERYFRFTGTTSWQEFAATCAAPLSSRLPEFEPAPKPVPSAFCLSVQTHLEAIEAITVLADYRALPDDESIARAWTRNMPAEEADAYQLAYAAIRSCGTRRLGSWHAMLSWTVNHSGEWRKAVSLRFPAPEKEDAAAG